MNSLWSGGLPGSTLARMELHELPADQLVKVRVELRGIDSLQGERLWAEPLGGDLYRIRNTPFHAYDLHFYDVVRAIPPAPGDLPHIVGIERRSGHKTLRVFFSPEHASPEGIDGLLKQLTDAGASYEHASGHLYALDVPPEADYSAICTWLRDRQREGVLHYETGIQHDRTILPAEE